VSDVRSVAFADPELPRSNGELALDEPWQGRALAMAIALVEQFGLKWDDFRRHLIAAVDADSERPYWDSWAVALEAFVAERVPECEPGPNSGSSLPSSGFALPNSGEKRAR
jgi:hypothetical protein